MCQIPQSTSTAPVPEQKDPSVSCFTCTRLNDTTFVIIEEDKWYEIPYIYVKVYPNLLVLFDTGCGGGDAAKNPAAGLTSIREYIETVGVEDNGGRPLNGGKDKEYIVVCTHCHFDHIGGVGQFPDAEIWASGADRAFLEKDTLPTNSICRYFDMGMPQYTISHFADDGEEVVSWEGASLGLYIYHTPGHTPDEVAVWDPIERVLFVGDTMYESVPIVFPLEGDLVAYFGTLDRLRSLVREWNKTGEKRVTMACGHATREADAGQLLDDVELFLCRLLVGEVKGREIGEKFRGEELVSYKEEGSKINFMAAERIFAGFRGNEEGMKRVRDYLGRGKSIR